MLNHKLLRSWREKNNLTSKDMAKLVNLSSAYYSNLENEQRKQPSMDIIKKISEVTNLSVDVLMSNNDNPALLHSTQELQSQLIEEQYKRLNLENLNLAQKTKIADMALVIDIKERILDTAQVSIANRYSVEKHRQNLVSIAKKLVQEESVPCYVVCEAFRISINTLKKWIGEDKLVFTCPYNLFPSIKEFNSEIAGQKFRCFSCALSQQGRCRGYGLRQSQNLETEEDIFSILENAAQVGITDRKQQVQFLKESYGIDITEGTLSEYLYRQRKGKHVPDEFKYME